MLACVSGCLGSAGGGNEQGGKSIFVDQNNSTGLSDGTKEFPWIDIASALNNSKRGDQIFVAPGTYVGNLTLKRDVDLIGASASECIIDGVGAEGLGIIAQYDVDDSTEVSGFTFQNWVGFGAVFLRGAINLHDCAIVRNSPPTDDTTDPFDDETVQPGGLYLDKPVAMTIRGCIIADNLKTGLSVFFPLQPVKFEGCLIVCNAGHGINLDGLPNTTEPEATFVNCTVANNLYNGIRIKKYANVELGNCAFASNGDIAVYETPSAGDALVSFCDIVGGYHDADTNKDYFKAGQINALDPPGTNTGNIVVAPSFKDESEPDLRFGLRASSPLIDAGDPDPEQNDRDGSRNDIGASGGPHSPPDPLTCVGDAFLGEHLVRWPAHGTASLTVAAGPDLSLPASIAQDLDGDGRPDPLVVRAEELCWSDAHGACHHVAMLCQPLALEQVRVLDLDLDGSLDLHAPGAGPGGRDLLLVNDAHGRFSERAELLGLREDTSLLEAAWVDVDQDCDADLVLRAGDGRQIVFLNARQRARATLVHCELPAPATLLIDRRDALGQGSWSRSRLEPGHDVLIGLNGRERAPAWLDVNGVLRSIPLEAGRAVTIDR